jgi:hypothetical protein
MRGSNLACWSSAAVLLASCSSTIDGPDKSGDPPVSETSFQTTYNAITERGSIEFEQPTAGDLDPGQALGFTFDAKGGGQVRIAMTSNVQGHPDGFLYLLGPAGSHGRRPILAFDDDSGGHQNPLINNFTLPEDGNFELVVTSYRLQSGGSFTVTMNCLNAQCGGTTGNPQTVDELAATRIQQVDIDNGKFTPKQLFDIGDVIFNHNFTSGEGLGNALMGGLGGPKPRPNLRRLQLGVFGGPDSSNCSSCHLIGGEDGAGPAQNNAYEDSNGLELYTGLERNSIAFVGDGWLQQLGAEMTQDLFALVAQGKAAAAASGSAVTVPLASKGVRFGTVIAKPDGTLDTSGVDGVDGDLYVRPLGWKGKVATGRAFAEGGLQLHLGLQTQPLVERYCRGEIPSDQVGTGSDCRDPDNDGVFDEITEGQLSALGVYIAMQEAPTRVEPTDPAALSRVHQGENLFTSVGCDTCHIPSLPLKDTVHHEPADLTGGAGISFDLLTTGQRPHPLRGSDGVVRIELFSDLRRHDMGESLADAHDQAPLINGVAQSTNVLKAREFLTRPLWGVAVSPPYLHDSRAQTLYDAIALHDGEAASVRERFLSLTPDDQQKVVEFLGTLSRVKSPDDQ